MKPPTLETTTETTYYFTGQAMQRLREEMGYKTQGEFADACGWTQQYQSQIELPGIRHEVTAFVRAGLKKAGVEI
jgi:hypothetical protein